jgi:cation:H+ antiporter
MQTLPEFAVEAVIAYHAGRDPGMMHLVTANFTGSLRLFAGLGWPMVFFIGYFASKKHHKLKVLRLDPDHSLTLVSFVPVLAYMGFIYFKGTLTWLDGIVLIGMYCVYLFLLSKMPAQEEENVEDLIGPPRRIMALQGAARIAAILACIAAGVLILIFCSHPFLESMLGIAMFFGLSQFVFVQWIAPILSEFPEKVSAFYWAKTNRGSMGLVNLVSSCVNQWTLLIGIIPFIVAYGAKSWVPVQFDAFQREEILLTILQGTLGMLFLLNLEFKMYEALGLFVLWIVQFIVPDMRVPMAYAYGSWVLVELVRLPFIAPKQNAFYHFSALMRRHVAWKRG